jgi:TatD DNase family protein
LIDTHAHLDLCEEAPETLVERARAAGVNRIVTVGTGAESARAALRLAERFEGVWAALGIHPHRAGGSESLGELRGLLAHPRAVAVGETGLDYYRDWSPPDRQRELFDAQLDLARALGKPVVVHSREAAADTLAALARFEGAVVLHCFSTPELLPAALEHGWYVSFAGNVTYPKALELREAAARVPAERILAETDCPYLAPVPRRGRPNEPALVVHTVAALAAARGEHADELGARIDENAGRLFGLS